MGMAASQARFLGLTARKTNVEYEGQQINQQRTTLSNQSANYYNQLLGMTVPVPPSVDNFTKTVYTFEDGAITNSITSLMAKNNGEYQVSYVSSYMDEFTPVANLSHVVVTQGSDEEGIQLYDDFVNGTAGGCYTFLNDTSHDIYLTGQFGHIIHVVNHMLGPGTYTTTDGNTVSIGTSGSSNDNIYWTTPQPPYGGDAATMASIAARIKDKPIAKKLVDLLYNTKTAYATGNTTKDTLDSLRDQLNSIVEFDLKDALCTTYMVGDDVLRRLGQTNDFTFNTDGTVSSYFGDNEYLKSLSNSELDTLIKEEETYREMLKEKYGDGTWLVRYVKNTTSGVYEPQFYKREDLQVATYGNNNDSLSLIRCYTMGSEQRTEETKGVTARLEKDSTGRYINITLNSDDPTKAVTYALTTNTLTDQDAYDDAMNQYEYDKYQYDQAIQEINAKIEIIQSQDKNLELRLKQLDTEQNAIQTEMDAVERVIEKNTETTFKTFG